MFKACVLFCSYSLIVFSNRISASVILSFLFTSIKDNAIRRTTFRAVIDAALYNKLNSYKIGCDEMETIHIPIAAELLISTYSKGVVNNLRAFIHSIRVKKINKY
ncbi:hypothetical protein BK128_03605 [Viridibacillus sp. FSL H7-0596]|nr:hypothetical protein BK128_03605 [Viridibacillus sp. FSL H7-0596]